MGRIHTSTARTFDATAELILATTPDDNATITLTTADLGEGYAYDHGFGDPTTATEIPVGAAGLFDLHFEFRDGGALDSTLAVLLSNDPDMIAGVVDIIVFGLAAGAASKSVPYTAPGTYTIPLYNHIGDTVYRYMALAPSAVDTRFRASVRKRHA